MATYFSIVPRYDSDYISQASPDFGYLASTEELDSFILDRMNRGCFDQVRTSLTSTLCRDSDSFISM